MIAKSVNGYFSPPAFSVTVKVPEISYLISLSAVNKIFDEISIDDVLRVVSLE